MSSRVVVLWQLALECHVTLTEVEVADDGLDPVEVGGGGAEVANGREEDGVQAHAHVDELGHRVAKELAAKDNHEDADAQRTEGSDKGDKGGLSIT